MEDLLELAPPPSVAARGVGASGTVKRRVRQRVGGNVSLGGALVIAGDWIACDGDGICVIPQAEVEDALERAAARHRSEDQVRAQITGGRSTRAIFDLPTHPPASVDDYASTTPLRYT